MSTYMGYPAEYTHGNPDDPTACGKPVHIEGDNANCPEHGNVDDTWVRPSPRPRTPPPAPRRDTDRIAHSLTITAAMCAALGIPPDRVTGIRIDTQRPGDAVEITVRMLLDEAAMRAIVDAIAAHTPGIVVRLA